MIKTCVVCGALPSSDDMRQIWDSTLQAYSNRYMCDSCYSHYVQWATAQSIPVVN